MSHRYTYTLVPASTTTCTSVINYGHFEKKLRALLKDRHISNENGYNETLQAIKHLTSALSIRPTTSARFTQELEMVKKHKPLTEPTPWGGVTLKKIDVEKDFIQKLLIIKKYGVLGFELHKKKKEHLKILEGYCLVFYINRQGKKNNTITVQLGSVGDEFDFAPNDEHGILTLSDCIIEETSTNHLDDLVYIFPASIS